MQMITMAAAVPKGCNARRHIGELADNPLPETLLPITRRDRPLRADLFHKPVEGARRRCAKSFIDGNRFVGFFGNEKQLITDLGVTLEIGFDALGFAAFQGAHRVPRQEFFDIFAFVVRCGCCAHGQPLSIPASRSKVDSALRA